MIKTWFKKLFIFLFAFSFFSCAAQNVPKWKVSQVEKYIAEAKGPVIINFWATFCIPCVKEIPYFQKLVKEKEKDSVSLLLVSLDLPDDYTSIKTFAAKHHFWSPIVFLEETNADYFCPKIDEKWSGAIPATLMVNNKTGYRKFFEEQIPENKLKQEIERLIAPIR